MCIHTSNPHTYRVLLALTFTGRDLHPVTYHFWHHSFIQALFQALHTSVLQIMRGSQGSALRLAYGVQFKTSMFSAETDDNYPALNLDKQIPSGSQTADKSRFDAVVTQDIRVETW